MTTPAKSKNTATLDGITLEVIVMRLSEIMGWDEMSKVVAVRCFTHDPSIQSSLKFLRRTPWARAKVEQLYLQQARKGFK